MTSVLKVKGNTKVIVHKLNDRLYTRLLPIADIFGNSRMVWERGQKQVYA